MKYQWVKGDNQGTVEEVKDSDNEWVNFTSGRRINQELINEYMIPINHESQIVDVPNTGSAPGKTTTQSYSFTQEDVDDTIRDAEGNVYTVPKNEPIKNKNINKQIESAPVHQTKKKEESPIKLLIKKSNKDKVRISYEFDIEIPKTNVFNIIQESFDVELENEILEDVMSDINVNDLKKSIKESIKEQIILHYNK